MKKQLINIEKKEIYIHTYRHVVLHLLFSDNSIAKEPVKPSSVFEKSFIK
jgi:hypothetical protein